MGDGAKDFADRSDELRDALEHFGITAYSASDPYRWEARLIVRMYLATPDCGGTQVLIAIEEERQAIAKRQAEHERTKELEQLDVLIKKHGVPRKALIGLSAEQIANRRFTHVRPARHTSDRFPIIKIASRRNTFIY